MNTDGPLLDADQIRGLLSELGARLEAKGLKARVFLVGGAAMALAINTRRSTRDLDGVFEPKSAIYAEAAVIAEKKGLPPDWLNDSVKGLLPDKVPTEVGAHFEKPGISVEIASAEYLFAMKAKSAREGVDTDDIRTLAQHLGLTTADEAIELVERYYNPYHLRPATRYLLEELLQQDPPKGVIEIDLDPER